MPGHATRSKYGWLLLIEHYSQFVCVCVLVYVYDLIDHEIKVSSLTSESQNLITKIKTQQQKKIN